MKIDFRKALLAGIVGTLALDLVGLLLTGNWWDIGSLRAVRIRTMIPARPGPTSSSQLNRPAGGSITVARHTITIMQKSTKGIRK